MTVGIEAVAGSGSWILLIGGNGVATQWGPVSVAYSKTTWAFLSFLSWRQGLQLIM